ncbi:MAG: hypothetical protein WC942_04905 [Clostridia bacterium]
MELERCTISAEISYEFYPRQDATYITPPLPPEVGIDMVEAIEVSFDSGTVITREWLEQHKDWWRWVSLYTWMFEDYYSQELINYAEGEYV